MLNVVDARSGRENVKIGERVSYPDGEFWTLVAVHDWIVAATAIVDTHEGRKAVNLGVRFTHPSFFLRRVGFFPS